MTPELRTPPAPADVLLADGTVATIRPVTVGDGPALVALHDSVGPENLRLRFFSASRLAGRAYAEHVVASPDTLALVAERCGELVAVATAEPVEAGTAEVAFLVADEYHGLGIGSLLLEHLAAAGRERGCRRFLAEVLAENGGMLDVLQDAGFAITRRPEAGSVHVEMDTTASYDVLRAADERECRSEARSLAPLLRPRSVAVVGARRDGSGVGAAVLRSIVAGGFTGAVRVVHREAVAVQGIPAVHSLTEIDGGVDLVVVAVPAVQVLDALRDAVAAGCRAAVVVSSGFAELGGAGAQLERAILELARAGSMRVVGPNCLGVMNNHPAVRLDATFSGFVPPAGGLALGSQSGGVGIVLADLARALGIGVSMLVSLGNKVDVSGNDLLAAWRDDPHVTAAALYLESFGNAPKFARVAREFSERKPLLAVIGGRSDGGRRAGASHTAAAASPVVGVRALLAQAGVLACDSVEELAEAALFLGRQPLPRGRRVAILTNAGGMGVLAADAAEDLGLVVPELSERVRCTLARQVSGTAGTTNPVDAGAGVAPRAMVRIAEDLLAADEVDALLVILVATGVGNAAGTAHMLPDIRRGHPEKPVLLVPLGGLRTDLNGSSGVTTYRSAASALRALAHAARYDEWRRDPHRPDPPDDPDRGFRARDLARDLAAARPDGGWLDVHDGEALLGEYALAPDGRVASGADAVVEVAREVGFPVVVKAVGRSVVHRTERGLVRVGLSTDTEVAGAVAAFEEVVGGPADVLVQPVVKGTEIALGVVRDPHFGPLVMVGAGGVATEIWDDRVFLVPPVSRRDAARAVRSLRVWSLLAGYRGAAAGDVAGLEDLLVRVARLADDVPAVAEMDLNPVVVGPDGCHLVDVKVRLDHAPVLDAGVPRRLRRPG